MEIQRGMWFRITREMKQDILSRNWTKCQYKTWRVGNKVNITFVRNDSVIIGNPKAASTTFSRAIIERAIHGEATR